jgi:hypothetical protein
MSMSLKSVIYGLAIFAFPIAPFVVFGGAFYILYAVNACITEVKNEGISRSSLSFQITETYCSTLGEDAAISIYGLDEAGGGRVIAHPGVMTPPWDGIIWWTSDPWAASLNT